MNLNSGTSNTIEDQRGRNEDGVIWTVDMLPYCELTNEEATANTTNAMIWGGCSGIIHGLIEMFGLLQEEHVAGDEEPSQFPNRAIRIVSHPQCSQ